ncbi:death-associated protein kinase related-like [Culicoides brevitarsis]|uniref:death-associated protein kinase related-like n=1 Tax=Culicoides brevitarsis TaxID=469753 RepID=UPI00307B7E45
MYADGITHKGQGFLEADYTKVLVKQLDEIFDVETSPFARGKFGTVRRAVHKKTGVQYAAKFLRRRRRDQCYTKDINHEIAVLMLCADSKHIINLYAVHETRLETALVLELVHGGELQTLLDIEGCLTEEQTIICLREILKALQYMHKLNIAHLDVKPQNILMNGEKVEDGLKLCDFGISRVINKSSEVREIVGTPDYVAPEVLQYDPVSLRTDIWSVGVLAYVLLSGCSPFAGDTKQETFLNISKCNLTFPEDLFETASSAAIDFITETLQIKPHERLNVEECLSHKWIKSSENGTESPASTESSVEKPVVIENEAPTCDKPEIVRSSTPTNQLPATPPRHATPKSVEKLNDKENLHCTPLRSNILSPSVEASVFPDAPTTPKVIRKASPLYSNLRKTAAVSVNPDAVDLNGSFGTSPIVTIVVQQPLSAETLFDDQQQLVLNNRNTNGCQQRICSPD